MYNPELYKGTLSLIVLHLLQTNGKMYGYEIVKLVEDISKKNLTLTEGALYPTLHKLENKGYIASEVFYTGKKMRKYYAIAPAGLEQLVLMQRDFKDFLTTIKKILK